MRVRLGNTPEYCCIQVACSPRIENDIPVFIIYCASIHHLLNPVAIVTKLARTEHVEAQTLYIPYIPNNVLSICDAPITLYFLWRQIRSFDVSFKSFGVVEDEGTLSSHVPVCSGIYIPHMTDLQKRLSLFRDPLPNGFLRVSIRLNYRCSPLFGFLLRRRGLH